ncbi:hypothetical protein ABEY41_04910 [Peribacillus butanolivorans]|uniref:hypothetical protein n=1 Tax=Peribacillus butanolivorans TaxID=421767 RepID=UPI003D2C34E7
MEHLVRQVDDICSLIIKLPPSIQKEGQQFPTPYLVLIDWGNDERDYTAVTQMMQNAYNMMNHIRILAEHAWTKYRVRSVVHPHAGGYIEFEDEIKKLMQIFHMKLQDFALTQDICIIQKWTP